MNAMILLAQGAMNMADSLATANPVLTEVNAPEMNMLDMAVYFGDIEAFKAYYAEKYGSAEVEKAFRGQINKLRIMIVYYPEINEYNGVESVQVIIRNYQ